MNCKSLVATALLGLASHSASALSVPFTETFAGGASGWLNSSSTAPATVASGGADGGGYISLTTDVADTIGFGGQTLFRCNDNANCSGDAFVGNWEANVATFSFAIRHDADVALEFFTRIATPFNFPAWAVESNTVVQPDTWTVVSFAIDPSNPLLTAEFGTFAQTFANVGNFQIGVSVPSGFTASGVTFDLDTVAIAPAPVPLPGAALFAVTGLASLLGFRRRA